MPGREPDEGRIPKEQNEMKERHNLIKKIFMYLKEKTADLQV
jgi:hypothetical protein